MYVLPTFLCRHYFTPSGHIGCLNTASFQVLTTLICPGSVTSYHTTMVSRSLRLHLGLMISCASPWTHAAPARGANLCMASVILQCDNENSVLAINSGHSLVPRMHLCLREIWFLTARYDIDIFAQHVAGVDNSIADHLSRWHLSPVHHTRFTTLAADTPTEHVLCSPHLLQFEIEC